MSPRSQLELLSDIQIRIERIAHAQLLLSTAAQKGNEADEDAALDSILYDLLVIGEAIKGLSKEFKDGMPHISWVEITQMRDFLAHQYFRIDSKAVKELINLPLQELLLICI